MNGELVLISGRYRGHRIPLRKACVRIGRDRSCEITLDDEAASRVHSEIVQQDERLILRDLNSTNGTFLNDARVTECPLEDGDRISVGDTVMLLQLKHKLERHTPSVVFAKEQSSVSTRCRLSLTDTRFLGLKEGALIPDAQRQLELLYDFMVDIGLVLHMPALLERAMNHFFKAIPAERGLILLLTPDGDPGLKVTRVRPGVAQDKEIRISQTMAQLLLQKKESFLSENVSTDQRLAATDSLRNINVFSILGTPLKVKDKVIGLLYFDKVGDPKPFSEQDLRLLTAMSMQLAVCLENTRLYNELLDAAELNNSVMGALNSGIIVVDNSGRILRVNRATEETLGFSEAQLLAQPLDSFPELAELNRVVQCTLSTGVAGDRNEVLVRANGEVVPLGLSTAVLSDHAGRIIGAVTNFRNLTQTRKLEEQVRRSEHLASLGQMAAGVAHEIRNPLNSIRGFAQLLQEKAAKDSPAQEYTQIILEEVDRMNGIVQDLLDFSRQRDLTLTPLDLDRVLEELVREMQDTAQHYGIAVRFQPRASVLPNVLGSADKLRQVFHNIIQNGIEACKPGGQVVLTAAPCEESAAPDGTLDSGLRPRRQVVVAVEDSGCGIDPAIMPKIFDPFFTLKEEGTGLGLSISQKIVEQHSGKVEVKRELGKGSVFTVFLPAV
ncbi:MAG: ATP-binding protein [Planctomycetota bacterium]